MPALRLLVLDTARDSAVAATIAAHRGDGAVAAVVHGAPSVVRWRSACAAIAREAGLVVVGGGRTGGGNLVLSSLGVDAEQVWEVPFGEGLRRPFGAGAVLAAMRLLGEPFVLAAARVSGPGDAARVRAAADALGATRPPAVLAVRGSEVDVEDGITITDAAGISEVPGGVRLDLKLGS